MAEIIPAIMPKDFDDLTNKLSMMKGSVPFVQIDIMDGLFTPQASWPYKKRDVNFEAIQKEEKGMPFWEDIDFEADLMVRYPEHVITQWVVAGATRIIIHIESTEKMQHIIDELKGKVEIGIAIGIDTPIDALEPYVKQVDLIQCMGIKRIGFQGEAFDRSVLQKIAMIKERFGDIEISVDGGVNLDTAQDLLLAGANRLVSGSAIFESDNYIDAIHRLQSID